MLDNRHRESNQSQNIQVFVRVRPLNSKEQKEEASLCVKLDPCNPRQIALDAKPDPKTFNFDWVGGMDTQQEEVFRQTGHHLVEAVLMGYNCTMFAYGQTGAGKTFTMQGRDIFETGPSASPYKGVQLRVLDMIFSRLRKRAVTEPFEFVLKCSYIEIYNEQIKDLLNSGTPTLQLREDFKKGVFVEGIVEETASSPEQAIEIFGRGARNRHIGATQMNQESSRSHSIFTITCEMRSNENGVTSFKSSKFNFVDLAGSERQKQTAASGERLKEATNINKSLTVLGSVINALVEVTEGKKVHVRFRDSKLTFLLKDSLGGNSKTVIIANVSPASTNFQETLSTLKFAQRAKMIKNKAWVNEESGGSVEALKAEIQRLKAELEKSVNCIPRPETIEIETKNERDLEDLTEKINDLTIKLAIERQKTSEVLLEKQAIVEELETINQTRDFLFVELNTKKDVCQAYKEHLEQEQHAKAILEERLDALRHEMIDSSEEALSENFRLRKELQETQRKLDLSSKEAMELKVSIEGLKCKLSSALGSQNSFKTSLRQMKEEFQALRGKYSEADAESTKKGFEIIELMGEMQEISDENQRLKQEMSLNYGKLDYLNQAKETIETENEKLKKYIMDLESIQKKSLNDFEKTLLNEKEKYQELQESYNKVQGEIQESKKKIMNEINHTKETAKCLRLQNESLNEQNKLLVEKRMEIEGELKKIKESQITNILKSDSEFEEFKKTCEAYEESIYRLENEKKEHLKMIQKLETGEKVPNYQEEKQCEDSGQFEEIKTLKEEIEALRCEIAEGQDMVEKLRNELEKSAGIEITKMAGIIAQYHIMAGVFEQIKKKISMRDRQFLAESQKFEILRRESEINILKEKEICLKKLNDQIRSRNENLVLQLKKDRRFQNHSSLLSIVRLERESNELSSRVIELEEKIKQKEDLTSSIWEHTKNALKIVDEKSWEKVEKTESVSLENILSSFEVVVRALEGQKKRFIGFQEPFNGLPQHFQEANSMAYLGFDENSSKLINSSSKNEQRSPKTKGMTFLKHSASLNGYDSKAPFLNEEREAPIRSKNPQQGAFYSQNNIQANSSSNQPFSGQRRFEFSPINFENTRALQKRGPPPSFINLVKEEKAHFAKNAGSNSNNIFKRVNI